jgi:ribosomal protein S18 acetylase RimI-like enzyme
MTLLVSSKIALRPATPEDIEFLAGLYIDTRRREVGAWGWPSEQQEIFLRMQFDAQCRSYRAAYPRASHTIICIDGAPAGRMLVDRESGVMCVVDIALLEPYRNLGIGTSLLQQLQEECGAEHSKLRLQVLHTNPAIRLYRRLGFCQTGADAMYAQMEWIPSAERS